MLPIFQRTLRATLLENWSRAVYFPNITKMGFGVSGHPNTLPWGQVSFSEHYQNAKRATRNAARELVSFGVSGRPNI